MAELSQNGQTLQNVTAFSPQPRHLPRLAAIDTIRMLRKNARFPGERRVNRIIRKQLEQIVHTGYRYTTDVVQEAAAEVLDTLGLSDGKCIFLSSDSEAVELGVRMTRRVTGQPLLLTLSDSYLAAYGSAGAKSPHEWYCLDWSDCVA